MKKICLFFCIFLITQFAFSQNKIGWEGTASGDYVIYRDYTWTSPSWTGFVYYGGGTAGALFYMPEKDIRVKILFSCTERDGKLDFTGQRILSENKKDETYVLAVNYLMQLLPELYKCKIQPKLKTSVIRRSTKNFTTVQFGNQAEFCYASYIPLFYLEKIKDSSGKLLFELEEMGRIKENRENVFFEFTPPSAAKKKSEFKLNKKAAKETKIVDGINLLLDAQWKQIADNSFLMGSEAFLTVNTVPSSSFSGIPDDVESSIVKLFSLSGSLAKVLVKNLETTGTEKQFKIENINYDVETKKITKDIKMVIKNKEGTHTVISLTVDNAVYEKHKQYFDIIQAGFTNQ